MAEVLAEERERALSEAIKALRIVEDKLEETLNLLEPHALPVVKGWLRSAKHRVFFIRTSYVARLKYRLGIRG